ncbi:MAG: helix-turn-helix transcriptional regulator [Firmicutes bacterium]|nr:helix-turn-helix transcriptional regulator [Bacillota bacterium]
MSNFSERLSELILEYELTHEKLAIAIGVSRPTVIRWSQNKLGISLANALNVANYFKCSLEFLIGRADNVLDFKLQPALPFYERLRQVMEKHGISWYRIVKDGIVTNNKLSSWKKGISPFLQSVIGIADYFNYTLDEFIGRDR